MGKKHQLSKANKKHGRDQNLNKKICWHAKEDKKQHMTF
jgi:hypothetical protein